MKTFLAIAFFTTVTLAVPLALLYGAYQIHPYIAYAILGLAAISILKTPSKK